MTSSSVSSAVFAVPNSRAGTTFDTYYLDMGQVLVAPTNGAYSTATSVYACQSTGPHLFSISFGVVAGQQAQVQLIGASNTVSPVLQRSTGQIGGVTYNGITTVARNVLLQCNTNYQAFLILQSGNVTNGPANYQLMSLVAFPYSPKYVSPTSWALYRFVVLLERSNFVFYSSHLNINNIQKQSHGCCLLHLCVKRHETWLPSDLRFCFARAESSAIP
jgi:hypothetical protein